MKNLLILLVSILAFYSCEKELKSIQLGKSEITIHYDESYQLDVSYSPTDVDIPPVFTWYSEDTEVAEVDQNGFVEGVKIGETDINVQTEDAKFQAFCKVIIEPISNLYKEPILEFGQSRAYVKNNETRDLLLETDGGISYEGDNSKVRAIMYLFDYTGLNGVGVLLESNESVLHEALTYLNERYDLMIKIDAAIFFKVNEDVAAVLSVDNSLGLNVIYMEHSFNKSSSSLKQSLNEKLIKARESFELLRR